LTGHGLIVDCRSYPVFVIIVERLTKNLECEYHGSSGKYGTHVLSKGALPYPTLPYPTLPYPSGTLRERERFANANAPYIGVISNSVIAGEALLKNRVFSFRA
jgi:hypothetical protein